MATCIEQLITIQKDWVTNEKQSENKSEEVYLQRWILKTKYYLTMYCFFTDMTTLHNNIDWVLLVMSKRVLVWKCYFWLHHVKKLVFDIQKSILLLIQNEATKTVSIHVTKRIIILLSNNATTPTPSARVCEYVDYFLSLHKHTSYLSRGWIFPLEHAAEQIGHL